MNATHNKVVKAILREQADISGVKIIKLAIAGDHIHVIIKLGGSNVVQARLAFQQFSRSLTGLIARHVLKAEKGRSAGLKFWDQRPFTRIIDGWKNLLSTIDYLYLNELESLGIVPYSYRHLRFLSG